MVNLREEWKRKANDFAIKNNEKTASQTEVEAWKQFKKIRNKVNNMKTNDEYKFKKPKMENAGDIGSMWSIVKGFMNWKAAGSLSQIQVGNVLYAKAATEARLMNEFFFK